MLKKHIALIVTLVLLTGFSGSLYSAEKTAFQPEDVFKVKGCREAVISPDGRWVAYTVSRSRSASDKPGGSYSNLFVRSLINGSTRTFISGKTSVWSVKWRPDGKAISFMTFRGKAGVQVWKFLSMVVKLFS